MLCYHQNVERLKHVPIIKTLESMLLFFLSPVGVLLRENNQAFCLHLHQAPCRLRLIIRTFFFTSPFSLPRFISKGKFYLTGSNFIFE